MTGIISWAFSILYKWFPCLVVRKYVSDQDLSQLDGFAIAQTTRITDLLAKKYDDIDAISSHFWTLMTNFNKRSLLRDIQGLTNRLLEILKDGMYWLDVKNALFAFEQRYSSCSLLVPFFDLHFRTDIQLCLWHLIDAWRKKLQPIFQQSLRTRPGIADDSLNQ